MSILADNSSKKNTILGVQHVNSNTKNLGTFRDNALASSLQGNEGIRLFHKQESIPERELVVNKALWPDVAEEQDNVNKARKLREHILNEATGSWKRLHASILASEKDTGKSHQVIGKIGGTKISREEIQCLMPREKLSRKIVDSFLSYINKQSAKNNNYRFHFFPSKFVDLLMLTGNESNKNNVEHKDSPFSVQYYDLKETSGK